MKYITLCIIALVCWSILAFGPKFEQATFYTVWVFICGLVAGIGCVGLALGLFHNSSVETTNDSCS